jgi:hypothetical protein
VQVALLAHRLRTPSRVQDFDYVPVNFAESTVLPDARKGFSVFLVASLDAEVGRLAHELRSAASRGNLGCISLPLASLPASLVLTIDGVLEREGVEVTVGVALREARLEAEGSPPEGDTEEEGEESNRMLPNWSDSLNSQWLQATRVHQQLFLRSADRDHHQGPLDGRTCD